MTCIVAVSDGRTVVIGGDSAATGENELRLRADRKVFCTGGYAIGFTRSYRMGQILRYGVDYPSPPREGSAEELERFMVVEFVEAVRRAFTEKGFAKKARRGSGEWSEEGQEVGGLFLVGVAGEIFEIREDFYVGRPAKPYSAVGFGATAALGALHALESQRTLSLRERAHQALAASEEYCSAVRGPFFFVEMEPGTDAGRCGGARKGESG